jgi:hypothetical protein
MRLAATIFMALVICCVDLTARTRRRISIRDGIWLLRIGDCGLRIGMGMGMGIESGTGIEMPRQDGNPQSTIRNPQSAIRNPQSAITL